MVLLFEADFLVNVINFFLLKIVQNQNVISNFNEIMRKWDSPLLLLWQWFEFYIKL